MWSLYELIWSTSLKETLREIKLLDADFEAGRTFFGRPYWNLGAIKRCLTKIPRFNEREFDTDIGVEIQYDGDGIRVPVSARTVIRVLPVVLAIRRFLRKQTQEATRLLDGGFAEIEEKYDVISGDIDARFRQLVEVDYFGFECSYFRTIFSLSLAKLDFKLCFPDANFSMLMSGLPEVRHSAPLRRIREMPDADESDVRALLHEFRHHYHVGLDICHPRWDEDADYVRLLLRQVTEQNSVPSQPEYQQVRIETAARLPFWKRGLFYRKLDQLRHLVWLREEMRDLSNRLYYQIRRWGQEVARRRGLGNDIYFMSYHQIFDDDRSSIESNRFVYESYRNFLVNVNRTGGQ